MIEDLESTDEMIELEYLLATVGPTGNKKKEKKQNMKMKLAALLIALGIEAELPAEFYEKLLCSQRAKVLLRTVTDDPEAKNFISKLNKC